MDTKTHFEREAKSNSQIACLEEIQFWKLFNYHIAGEQALSLGDIVRGHARMTRERRSGASFVARSRVPALLGSLASRYREPTLGLPTIRVEQQLPFV